MEVVISWIELAYSLNDNQRANMTKLENAFENYQKTKEMLVEARQYVESLLSQEAATDDQMEEAQHLCEKTVQELKKGQMDLLWFTIDSCIGSLKVLNWEGKSSDEIKRKVDLVQGANELIEKTKLKSSFGKIYPRVFSKLKKAVCKASGRSPN